VKEAVMKTSLVGLLLWMDLADCLALELQAVAMIELLVVVAAEVLL
jgi:hypothetical protein